MNTIASTNRILGLKISPALGVFIGYLFLLALRDFLFRNVALTSVDSSLIFPFASVGIFLVIVFCLSIGRTYRLSTGSNGSILQTMASYDWKLVGVRTVFSILIYTFMFEALEAIDATSFSLIAKIVTPILILRSFFSSDSDKSKFEVFISLVVILSVCIYMGVDEKISLQAAIYAGLAVIFAIAEVFTLKKASKGGENSEVLIPVLFSFLFVACMKIDSFSFEFSYLQMLVGILAGVFAASVYLVSKARYKYLPVGISELPAAFCPWVLLPFDIYVLNASFDEKQVFLIFSIPFLLLLIAISFFKKRKLKQP